MYKEIKVSILCLAYNHEKYIRKCLEGFVMQKTNFKFEVLINDDCSTDNTAQIIKEYEEKYPDIIKPIYQTENQYSKGVKIMSEVLAPLIKGEYVAFCEGDDYWCDDNKLQMQYDVMEENPNCKMCVHKVTVLKEGVEQTSCFPYYNIKSGIIESRKFIEITEEYLFQTSSYFISAEAFKVYVKEKALFSQISLVEDQCYLLYFGSIAPVFYIDKAMSCYRKMSTGSWNEKLNKGSEEVRRAHCLKMIDTYRAFNEYSQRMFYDSMQMRILQQLYKLGEFKKIYTKEFKTARKKLPRKVKLFIWLKGYCPVIMKILKK